MATSKTAAIVNEIVDDFPAMQRPNSGNRGQRKNDVDVQLEQYRDAGAQGVLKFLDFNTDTEGNEVDGDLARQRAQGRVAGIKARGYTVEDGWVIAARNGCLYAKYYGPGNVPDNFIRKTKAVGEDAVDSSPVGERVPMPAFS